MEQLTSLDLATFLDLLASKAPAPGGGSASALLGATGAALGMMTANLTIGKKKYAALWEQAEANLQSGMPLCHALLQQIDADTAAFNVLMDALALPKETDAQKAIRRDAVETAAKAATEAPLAVLGLCRDAAVVLEQLYGKVNPNCISDLGVGAAALQAGARGAWLNVCINLGAIRDASFVEAAYQKGQALVRDVSARCDALYGAVASDCDPFCNQN